ncbi:hypothetical protein GCG54_00008436 [Colletotrichum gloeosporioides]|uniref:2EXR domain-containing protein n=1 Tax=Colletotrichum gloeosporioides TaxID=474922 RepID=A0A8H4CHA7_COLGL|nr:uncharacterized protein GCG54_00008436 [Colletotrichum gloeosporioides]KAF3803933.1 hypothetical protein GCG54_00008436 [Colletotrichum gloeosporioides]
MATQTFTPFSDLCPELRAMIWDFATRPHGIRGVQHFSIFHRNSVPTNFEGHIAPMIEINQIEVVVAPSTIDSTTGSSYNNNSTYTIDSGLWTACRESRAAMFRRYRPDEWTDFYEFQKKKYSPDREPDRSVVHLSSTYHDMPATFEMNHGEKSQFFTVLPATDLIFIHLTSLRQRIWDLSKQLPFASWRLGFGGMCHIALEFDPSWSIAELEQYQQEWEGGQPELSVERWKEYDMLVQTSRNVPARGNLKTLWLVDRRLRREHLAPTADQLEAILKIEAMPDEERMVFHEGGCRYFGMPTTFYERWLWAYEDQGSVDSSRETVWQFVHSLQWVATVQAMDRDNDSWNLLRGAVQRWGVLLQSS